MEIEDPNLVRNYEINRLFRNNMCVVTSNRFVTDKSYTNICKLYVCANRSQAGDYIETFKEEFSI